MKAYNKRMKGSWTQGKGYKGDGAERQYSKFEIRQELAAAEEGYLERYHKGGRTRNNKAHLEYRVRWHEQALATENSWYGDRWKNYLRDGLEKAKKKLAECIAKGKK